MTDVPPPGVHSRSPPVSTEPDQSPSMREGELEEPSCPVPGVRLERVLRVWQGARAQALLWSSGVSVVAQAGGFVMNLLLARTLGKSGFGEWATVQNTVGMVSGIAQLSMTVTAMKFVAQYRESSRARVGPILLICAAVTLTTGALASSLMFATAPWVAGSILKSPSLGVPIQIAVATLFLLTINGYQVGALTGLERFRTLAVLGAAHAGYAALLAPAGARIWGVRGALAGHATALLVTWYLHRRFLNRELAHAGIRMTTAGVRREAGVLAHFAVPATLAGIVGMLGVWLSTVILVRSASGLSEMASLAVATTLRAAVLFAPNIIDRVAGPALNHLIARGGTEYRESFRRNVLLTLGSAVACALPIGLFAPALLGLFGRSFRDGSAVVIVMAASGVVEALSIAISQHFLSHARMWFNLVVVTARSVTLVAATYYLVPGHAAVGAAYANLLAFAVHVLVAYALMRLGTRAHPAPSRASLP